MNVLALDIGTSMGWAANDAGHFKAGTWELATKNDLKADKKLRFDRRRDIRFGSLVDHLRIFRELVKFDVVIFEDVEFQSSRLQMQLWASLRAAIWAVFSEDKPIVECVNVKTLKAFAGHGNTDKAAMSRFLKAQYPCYWNAKYDDNAIDAIWLWLWAQKNLARSPWNIPNST